MNLQNDQLVISGNRKGLSTVVEEIKSMINGISSEEKTYNRPEICRILTKDHTMLAEIEGIHRSVIMFTDQAVNDNLDSSNQTLRLQRLMLEEGGMYIFT